LPALQRATIFRIRNEFLFVVAPAGIYSRRVNETNWEQLYQTGDTRWEKGEASPGLVDFLAAHPELPRGSVLVPGCGFGHDVRVWAGAGFAATGLDIAPSAVRGATERTTAGLGACFRLADFLAAEPDAQFDWLFEHTLFCAIPPARRDDYVRAALRWLKPGGQVLAMHYMLREGAAEPPFGVSQEELMERFAPHFDLVQGFVPRSYANRTGLELLLWWRRK
jgi:cyclopropane fatty-acyl-phospholipid synthase-like methyltransferase